MFDVFRQAFKIPRMRTADIVKKEITDLENLLKGTLHLLEVFFSIPPQQEGKRDITIISIYLSVRKTFVRSITPKLSKGYC